MKVLIVYYSTYGNVYRMAKLVADGVRQVAAWALGRVGGRDALRQLSDALRFDFDEGVRCQAVIGLCGINDGAVQTELARAVAKDASERVRSCATRGIERLQTPLSKQKSAEPKDKDLVED